MDAEIAAQLVELNRRFYEEHGASFASTRRRLQPGVFQVLDTLPDEGQWLDVGCGSGALGLEWLRRERSSAYLGVDFSGALLAEAAETIAQALPAQTNHAPHTVGYAQIDLADPHWHQSLALPAASLRGVLAFAVLHHIPSEAWRMRILTQIHTLLAPGGCFYFSNWQFQHSPKLMARRQPWQSIGLDPAAMDAGDTLLDWRADAHDAAPALRYVHLFSAAELENLAQRTGFSIRQTFESDGQGGRLGLYAVWQKVGP